mgnify:FL=1
MTSKQRAMLRAMANEYQPIIYIGKEGVTDALIQDADAALEARELVKGSIGRNAEVDLRTAVAELCQALQAEPIQVIGRKFVIFRPSQKNPTIQL